ncbi:MAG: HAMP domain-containing sensor histidine kinase, partial [Acidobacteria bacterium]|nr:HAMP domain-containing sensor histidine kinase [Acidobacteriota bacterium]
RIETRLEMDENLEVKGMASRIERVFVNLVANALEVMPEGGRLLILATAQNGTVFVDVEDTGPGVPGSIVDRLFQPFATAGKKNGMGLGLALSRQTILDHGGDLWLDSRPGESARFRIRLPLSGKISS